MRYLCDFACFLAKQVLSQLSYTPTRGMTASILSHLLAHGNSENSGAGDRRVIAVLTAREFRVAHRQSISSLAPQNIASTTQLQFCGNLRPQHAPSNRYASPCNRSSGGDSVRPSPQKLEVHPQSTTQFHIPSQHNGKMPKIHRVWRTVMSHHLDSPIARQDIRLDITDLYVFRGESGTAFVSMFAIRFSAPFPPPATTRKERTNLKSI
jgi:hypothetical protein